MLTGIFIALVSLAAGYLLRRWHRPTGYTVPRDTLKKGEWRIMVAGGSPYVSTTVRGRYAVSPLGLAELQRAMQDGAVGLHARRGAADAA
jgi:hypothetical protein